ncbi:hypothetical protein BGX26_003273 [Mortierella sp. AD094]|nr:hypothetical protein BGX26_003273 [Mortierella sp. AD094]
MNPYYTPPSISTLPSSSLGSTSSSSSSQNQLRQDRPSGYHRMPSFSAMPRQGSSSSDVATLASPYMPPSVNHNVNHFNNHSPMSSNSASSSKNSYPVTSSHPPHHHAAPHGIHNQESSLIQHHHNHNPNHDHNHGHNHNHNHDHDQSPHPHHNHNQSFDPSSHVYEDEGLDEEEDQQSDEGSEGEPGFNEMEYWLQRCSICFDARLDFCLEFCRDQFCRDCFQRYVKEVVSNSWGLNVTKIKCPVCQDTIAQSEWTKYVDQSTLAQYNQYNQPYRSFSRFCNECEHELVISQVNRSVIGLPVRELQPLFENLLQELRSLLTLAGLNLNDPNAVSSKLSHVKSKQRLYLTSQDEFAREIVQRFMDDYESFCGIPQGPQLSLPSKAQSYLSNLAYRTLGGPFILPTPSPPASASSESFSHSSSLPPQFHQHPTASSSSSSVPRVQIPQPKASTQSNAESMHRNQNALFQRRQHPVKASGVLEIYKSLMIPLLDLLDLQAKDKRDETDTSYCEYVRANGPKGDSLASGEDESATEHHMVENLELAVDSKDKNTDASPSANTCRVLKLVQSNGRSFSSFMYDGSDGNGVKSYACNVENLHIMNLKIALTT